MGKNCALIRQLLGQMQRIDEKDAVALAHLAFEIERVTTDVVCCIIEMTLEVRKDGQ